MNSELLRRNSLPLLHFKGSHYDVGRDMGRTFAAFIQNYVENNSFLNKTYIPKYETKEGRHIYEETLGAVAKKYPQYLREIEGMAEGANVPFYKLFLLHLDDVILSSRRSANVGQGCSTILLNRNNQKIIGHTEDGLQETLNLCYLVKVHITESGSSETFTAFCYPGLLPGYAMGFNDHFAFTVNIIAVKNTSTNAIPRTFITRALYGADSLDKVQDILRCRGIGIADALSLNVMTIANDKSDCELYNIEIGPNFPATDESALNMVQIEPETHLFHANKFLRIKLPEVHNLVDSSSCRHETEKRFTPPSSVDDVISLLGDESSTKINIFRNRKCELVSTLAVGIFDGSLKTWNLYLDNPKTSTPIVSIPLTTSK